MGAWIIIIWLHSNIGAPTVGPTFECSNNPGNLPGRGADQCQLDCEAAAKVLQNAGINAVCIKKTR